MKRGGDAFWQRLDHARTESGGSVDAMYEILRDEVFAYEPDELMAFAAFIDEQMARAHTHPLAHASRLLLGERRDAFTSLRAWLVSRGRAALDAAIADPDSLVDHVRDDDDPIFELLPRIAEKAWARFEGDPELPEELPRGARSAVLAGPDWSQDEATAKLPRIVALAATKRFVRLRSPRRRTRA